MVGAVDAEESQGFPSGVTFGVKYANRTYRMRDATSRLVPINTHPVHGLYTFNILLEHNSYLFRNLAFVVLSCFRLVLVLCIDSWPGLPTHPFRSVVASFLLCFRSPVVKYFSDTIPTPFQTSQILWW